MNLHRMLRQRADEGRPLRIGLIGAGKFGSMYLSQARRTPGIQLVGVAGQPVRWSDVVIDAKDPAVAFRREMERTFGADRLSARR